MKIVDLKLTPVSHPAPPILRWGRVTDTVGGIIVQVITDGGIVGLGEFETPYAEAWAVWVAATTRYRSISRPR